MKNFINEVGRWVYYLLCAGVIGFWMLAIIVAASSGVCRADFSEEILPNADSSPIALTTSTGSTHFNLINDDSDTTYVYRDSDTYLYDYYHLANHDTTFGYGDISSIEVCPRVKEDVNGFVKVCVKQGSETASCSSEAAITSSSYYEHSCTSWNVRPTGWAREGEAWKWDDVDALIVGVGLKGLLPGGSYAGYCSEIKVNVKKNEVVLWWWGGYGDYHTFYDLFEGLGNLTADTTVLIEPGIYREDTYSTNGIDIDLNGHALIIKPSDNSEYPAHSSPHTGVRVICDYDSADDFLYINATDAGRVIVEGLSIEVDSASTAPTAFINIANQDASTVSIRRNILKGDGVGSTMEGIQDTVLTDAAIQIEGNFIYDVYDGILLAQDQETGSYIKGNTIYGCIDDGIDGGGGTATGIIKDNLVQGSGGDDFAAISDATGSYNVCDDASCAGEEWGNASSSNTTKLPNDTYSYEADNFTGPNCAAGVLEECYDVSDGWTERTWTSGTSMLTDWLTIADFTPPADTYVDYVDILTNIATDNTGSYYSLGIGDSDLSNSQWLPDAETGTFIDNNYTFTDYSKTFTTAPDGSAWEWSDIEDSELLIGVATRDTGDAGCSTTYLAAKIYYEDTNGNQFSTTVTFTSTSNDAPIK